MDEANRFISTTRPWDLVKARETGDLDSAADLDEVLSALLLACRTLTFELQPFLPAASARIARALADRDPQLGRRLFTKPVCQ